MKSTMLPLLLLLPLFVACGGGNNSDQSQDQVNEEPASEEQKTADSASPSRPPGMPPATQREESIQSHHEGLAYLEDYLGKRPAAVNLWQSEPLHSMLKDLLGHDLPTYLDIMQEAMPLSKDRVVYTVGIAPDDAVPGIGYLLVDTEKDKLRVFTVFGDLKISAQSPGADLYLPQAVKEKIEQVLGVEAGKTSGALLE